MVDKATIMLLACGLLIEPAISFAFYPCFSATLGIAMLIYVRSGRLPDPLLLVPLGLVCDLVTSEFYGIHSLSTLCLYFIIPSTDKMLGRGTIKSAFFVFLVSYILIRATHCLLTLYGGSAAPGNLFYIPFELFSAVVAASLIKTFDVIFKKQKSFA